MITKAIIRRLTTSEDNHFIVYVPYFQKANDTEDVATVPATLVYIPGISNTLRVGDVVYVGFEDNYTSKPVILGKLFTGMDGKDKITTTLTTRTFEVIEKTSLPYSTNIGDLNINSLHTKLNHLLETNNYEAENIIYDNEKSPAVNVKEELDRLGSKIETIETSDIETIAKPDIDAL